MLVKSKDAEDWRNQNLCKCHVSYTLIVFTFSLNVFMFFLFFFIATGFLNLYISSLAAFNFLPLTFFLCLRTIMILQWTDDSTSGIFGRGVVFVSWMRRRRNRQHGLIERCLATRILADRDGRGYGYFRYNCILFSLFVMMRSSERNQEGANRISVTGLGAFTFVVWMETEEFRVKRRCHISFPVLPRFLLLRCL